MTHPDSEHERPIMNDPGATPPAATPSAATTDLSYEGTRFINFDNATFQWVNVKLFALPGQDLDDRAVLALLLANARYRDSYAGTGDEDMGTIHGPFRLDAITVDSFAPADAAAEVATLGEWAQRYAPLSEAVAEQVETEVYRRVRDATSRYRLVNPGEDQFHEWGFAVGNNGFHELVVIDRPAGSVALIVASDD